MSKRIKENSGTTSRNFESVPKVLKVSPMIFSNLGFGVFPRVMYSEGFVGGIPSRNPSKVLLGSTEKFVTF
jgi:hypothetical protein